MENNPITRVFPDFSDEVMKIDPRLSVVVNENRKNIANIKLDGEFVCAIPATDIREHRDAGYTSEMPNGMVIPHCSKEEALARIKSTLELIKNPENSDAFFGRNGF